MAVSRNFRNVAMFLLAWFPILNIYKSPLPLGYGSVLVLLLWVVSLIQGTTLRRSLSLPRQYVIFWGWCAVAYFISYLPQLKIGALIPGGFNLFIFSITLGFLLSIFDIESFKKHSKIVVVAAGVILVFQEALYFTTGSRPIFLLPFGQLMDEISVPELIAEQMRMDRSSSLFREPAHFAQYLLPLLCLELFSERNKEKLFTPYSIFIIAILVLLRSGNGFLGLVILLIVKAWTYLKNVRMGTKIMAILIAAPLAFYAVSSYISTEVGSAMLERTNELENDDSAASYIRVYRGYALYSELPFANQLFGINDDRLMQVIPRTSISYLFAGTLTNDTYMNGVQSVMIHQGLIGLLLCVWMYVGFARRRPLQSKMQIWLLLLLSLFGQTFMSNSMLYCTLLCVCYNNKKSYENSLLHTA